MTLLLVRHAKAGSRKDWDGPDDRRPLSQKGRRQAERLVRRLAETPVARVVSSPSLRCVQTVEPLAADRRLGVETSDALAEGAAEDDVLALVRELAPETAAGSVVLCTHGDVIPTLLDALARDDGLQLPPDYPCAKASTWLLEADGDGRLAKADYLPAP